ncbi:MAG: hypothetical protein H7332_17190 [Bdellovibrionales bacterium]|nr:hypothetical protein [Ramlibacter sp.]
MISVNSALAVPGQFATLRETGGYDTRQDAAVEGLVSMNQAMVANIR